MPQRTLLSSDQAGFHRTVKGWAVGDGVTDDTGAFNEAITAVSSNGGGVLWVPNGNYKITGDGINMADNVWLMGQGYGSRIFCTATSLNDGHGMINFDTVKHCGLDNLLLDGQITVSANVLYTAFNSNPMDPLITKGTSVWVHPGCTDLRFRSIRVVHTGGYAILLDADTANINDVKIEDCDFVDCRPHLFGITTSVYGGAWTSGIFYRGDCRISSNKLFAVNNLKIHNCHFKRLSGNGIWGHCFGFDVQHTNIAITHCTFEDIARDCIQPGNSFGVTVSHCTGHRIGYVTGISGSDTDAPVPLYIPGAYAVGLDSTGFVRAFTYSNVVMTSVNGGGFDLDGCRDGVVDNCSCIIPQPEDPQYVTDSISSFYPNGNGLNASRGIQTGNSSLNGGAQNVSIRGGLFSGLGLSSIVLAYAKGCSVRGVHIVQPTGAIEYPIQLFAAATGSGDENLCHDNVVEGNQIDYTGALQCVAETGTGWIPQHVNRVQNNDTTRGVNGGEFIRNPGSGSGTSFFSSTNSSSLIASTRWIWQTEGGGLEDQLATGLTTSAPTVAVNSGALFANNDHIMIDGEIMLVTGGGGTPSLTVTRSKMGTVAAVHLAGATVINMSSTAAQKGYAVVAGYGQQELQIAFAGPVFNLSNNGNPGTGAFVTGSITSLAFFDCVATQRVVANGFLMMGDGASDLACNIIDPASQSPSDHLFIRWNKGSGQIEQSVATDSSAHRIWSPFSGSGGVAGSDKAVQYNRLGSQSGDANFYWDYTNKLLVVVGVANTAGIDVLNGYMQSDQGFFTTSTNYNAIQAPLGGVTGLSLTAANYTNLGQHNGLPTVTVGDSFNPGAVYYDSGDGFAKILLGSGWARILTSAALTAAGPNTSVQFNNGGVLSGSSNFNYDNSSLLLSVYGNSGQAAIAVGNDSYIQSQGGFLVTSTNTSFSSIQSSGGALLRSVTVSKYVEMVSTGAPPTVSTNDNFSPNGVLYYDASTGTQYFHAAYGDNVTPPSSLSDAFFYGAGLYASSSAVNAIQAPNGGFTGKNVVVTSGLYFTGGTLPSTPSSGQMLIASDGTHLWVSENGGAFTRLTGSGAAAAGSTGQVQFNNSGPFGASADLTWNGATLFAKALGIQNASPLYAKDFGGTYRTIITLAADDNLFIDNTANANDIYLRPASGRYVVIGNGGSEVLGSNGTITIGDASFPFVSIFLTKAVYITSNASSPSTPPGGYTGFSHKTGSIYWYYNPTTVAWAQVDFAQIGSGVITVAGTTSQVLVNGGTGATAGAITLTLPQSIATTSGVTFDAMILNSSASNALNVPNGAISAEGVAAQSSATNAIQTVNGGMYSKLGIAVDQALYAKAFASATMGAPSGGYGALAYQGGSVYYYWNGSAWATINFSTAGGTVTSVAGTSAQVLVNGGTTAQSGAVTISLPGFTTTSSFGIDNAQSYYCKDLGGTYRGVLTLHADNNLYLDNVSNTADIYIRPATGRFVFMGTGGSESVVPNGSSVVLGTPGIPWNQIVGVTITASSILHSQGGARIEGSTNFASGIGLELQYNPVLLSGVGAGVLQAYDRGASAYKPMYYAGLYHYVANGNVGIGIVPTTTAGQALLVQGSFGVAGIHLVTGFMSSDGGFVTSSSASNAIQTSSGGMYASLGYTSDQALYLKTLAGTPNSPGGGYAGFGHNSGSTFWYYNPGTASWHTVDFASIGGGVSALFAGTGVSVSANTGSVTVSIGQNVGTGASVAFNQLSIASNNLLLQSNGNLTMVGTLFLTGGSGTGLAVLNSNSFNSIQTALGGMLSKIGFFVGTSSSATTVINSSGQFTGNGVLCTGFGVAAAGFNPFVGGVQYSGVGSHDLVFNDQFGTSHTISVRGGAVVGIS